MAHRRRVGWTLLLVTSVLGMLCTGATAPARPRLAVATSVSIVAKIIGGTDTGPEPVGLPILNAGFDAVDAADLGAITLYRNTWYLALGDVSYDFPLDSSNFLVAKAPYTPDLAGTGIRLT